MGFAEDPPVPQTGATPPPANIRTAKKPNTMEYAQNDNRPSQVPAAVAERGKRSQARLKARVAAGVADPSESLKTMLRRFARTHDLTTNTKMTDFFVPLPQQLPAPPPLDTMEPHVPPFAQPQTLPPPPPGTWKAQLLANAAAAAARKEKRNARRRHLYAAKHQKE